MEIENIKVGMFVKDKLGNEYKVVGVSHNIVKLLCEKFVKQARVDSKFKFQKVGDVYWITTSEEDAKEIFGQYIDISIKSIEKIKRPNKKILKKFLKRIDKIEKCMDDGDVGETYYELVSLKRQLIEYFDKKLEHELKEVKIDQVVDK